MAAIAYATVDDYNLYQLRGSETNPQLQFRLNSARDKITSCLYKGKYSVATVHAVIAAGDYYAVLKELNIVMAHLSIISGASASEVSDSAGRTYLAYRAWMKETLEVICAGNMALTSDSGDSEIEPPKSIRRLRIAGDDRHNNTDLTSPVNYTTPSPLRSDE